MTASTGWPSSSERCSAIVLEDLIEQPNPIPLPGTSAITRWLDECSTSGLWVHSTYERRPIPSEVTWPRRKAQKRRTESSVVATAVTYAACVMRQVAITSGGQRHGGGVRPRSGNSENVAVMSVAPKIALAQGS
jgi:hypothetical protein